MSAVFLRIYDLSQGMARGMSQSLLGKQIDGIWHTGVVVYDREYYFGGGICSDPPGNTPYGTPYSIQDMGTTEKSLPQFMHFLQSISHRFSITTYHLLENNCNNFSEACCQFLLAKSIPQYILDLPSEAMNSPMGPFIRPVIEQMQSVIQQQSSGHEVSWSNNNSSATPASASSSFPPTPTSPSSTISHKYWSSPVVLEKGDRKLILSKLTHFAPHYTDDPTQLIQLTLSLPLEKAFPALDLLRLHIAESEQIASNFAADFPTLAARFILHDNSPFPACMMALRCIVNCFKYPASSTKITAFDTIEPLVECIATGLLHQKPQIRKTAAVLALNLAGAPLRYKTIPKLAEDHSVRVIYSMVEHLNSMRKPPLDEVRPILSALIVLVENDEDAAVLVQAFGLVLEEYQSARLCDDALTRAAASDLSKLLASI